MSLLLCFSLSHRPLLRDSVFLYAIDFLSLFPMRHGTSKRKCSIDRYQLYIRPCFSSSFLGLINAVINVLIRDLLPVGQVTVVALTLSAISTGCYAAAALYHLMSFEPNFSFRRQKKPKDSLWSDDGTALLTEDDMQRQQLRNLLKQTTNRSPSPDVSQHTFRIDLPEDTSYSRGRADRHLTLPQHAYSGSSSKTPSITVEESPSSWEMNTLRPQDVSGHNRSSSWGL